MNKIVNFHVVSDAAWFEKIIVFLKSRYKMAAVELLHEYMSGNIGGSNLCHITVDDGDKTFYENIYPVLKKHKVPASMFVSPKICEEKGNFWFQEIAGYDQKELVGIISDVSGIPYLSLKKYKIETIFKSCAIRQIEEIIKRYQNKTRTRSKPAQNMSITHLIEVSKSNLVSVGAHTQNHPILLNEDDKSSNYEIKESVTRLSDILDTPIKFFAYPNGIRHLDFSEREEQSLKQAGIQLAFTTEVKNLHLSQSKLRVPRIGISDLESIALIKTKVIMGSQWGRMRRLNRNSEYCQRNDLINLKRNYARVLSANNC